jgi:hypothetical protein
MKTIYDLRNFVPGNRECDISVDAAQNQEGTTAL